MPYAAAYIRCTGRYVHLTNVAVQKADGSGYNAAHGNKWALADLRLHLEATRGHAAAARLFEDIQELVVHTLQAVQPVGRKAADMG